MTHLWPRGLTWIAAGAGMALLGAGSRADAVPLADLLQAPLACRFQAVSLGQFHGLDYGPGTPSGTSAVVIAASADDLRQGRAALIEQDSASAARILDTARQALLVATTSDGNVTTLTVFTAAGASGAYPAVLARQTLIGDTPVLVQSTGTCRPQTEPR